MVDLFYANKYTLLLYLDLEEPADNLRYVYMFAKIWSSFLNFQHYFYEQMLILTLPVKVLASKYEWAFSYYVFMTQIYESSGVLGIVFVLSTSFVSFVYLFHNVVIPFLYKLFRPSYSDVEYHNNSPESTSNKKPSFFKKWFK